VDLLILLTNSLCCITLAFKVGLLISSSIALTNRVCLSSLANRSLCLQLYGHWGNWALFVHSGQQLMGQSFPCVPTMDGPLSSIISTRMKEAVDVPFLSGTLRSFQSGRT
jgi:hypothetical protein